MAELLRPHADARPDEPALTDERGTTTWRELDARTDRLANALRGLGLATGDVIAIHSGNRREFFEAMCAAGHIGLRYVLVNWHWTASAAAWPSRLKVGDRSPTRDSTSTRSGKTLPRITSTLADRWIGKLFDAFEAPWANAWHRPPARGPHALSGPILAGRCLPQSSTTPGASH